MSTPFEAQYGRPAQRTWFAPGRVNLIGEHTDYNDGFAIPMALPLGVRVGAARGTAAVVRVVSAQHPGELVTARVDELRPRSVQGWGAYAMGVLWALREEGHRLAGIDLLIDGEVPVGAGLSSSAALECAVACVINDLLGLGCSITDLIRIARRAENDYVGVPTGALDQTASMMCHREQALFIDFRSMHTRLIPLDLRSAGLALVVIDTRAPHRLVDGEYATRRAECTRAAALLSRVSLRDVAIADLAKASAELTDSVLRQRLTHVVTENARALSAVRLLDAGEDPRELGPLLTASHVSLSQDYEVSCPELDAAVEAALDAGASGARMTGGGFGGSAIALVEEGDQARIGEAVRRAFQSSDFTEPAVFSVQPGPGAHRIRIGA